MDADSTNAGVQVLLALAEAHLGAPSAAQCRLATIDPGTLDVDARVDEIVEKLTSSGVVSAAGNRKAFRAGEEPLDAFRRYMAIYAREQADCHLSPALVANLERNWKKRA